MLRVTAKWDYCCTLWAYPTIIQAKVYFLLCGNWIVSDVIVIWCFVGIAQPYIPPICLSGQKTTSEGKFTADNRRELDGEIKTTRKGTAMGKHRREEDKDISYAKLAHNVMCDSSGCCPSHTQRGVLGGREAQRGCWGELPNRGRLELLAFDSADPGSQRIPGDTKQIWALG